jgi:hypothetical protein
MYVWHLLFRNDGGRCLKRKKWPSAKSLFPFYFLLFGAFEFLKLQQGLEIDLGSGNKLLNNS